MKESPFALERELGMQYYATGTPGIGGTLRTVPEDFLVDEIPLEGKGSTAGPYLICRLTKTSWELQHAVKEIARRLNISHRRIGWAGTKDRNARTTQLISLYKVTPEEIAAIYLKDITLEPVGQSNEQLSLGDLEGNRFDICIRDADPEDLAGRVADGNRDRIAGPAQLFRAPAVRRHPPADAPGRGTDPAWRLRAGGDDLRGKGIPLRVRRDPACQDGVHGHPGHGDCPPRAARYRCRLSARCSRTSTPTRTIMPVRSGSCRQNSSRCLSPRSSRTCSTAPSRTDFSEGPYAHRSRLPGTG